jgi:hypothetical protein
MILELNQHYTNQVACGARYTLAIISVPEKKFEIATIWKYMEDWYVFRI